MLPVNVLVMEQQEFGTRSARFFSVRKRVAVNLLTECLHNFQDWGNLVKRVLSYLGKPGMTRADDFMPKVRILQFSLPALEAQP